MSPSTSKVNGKSHSNKLLEILSSRPQDLLLSGSELQDASKNLIKSSIDPIASSYSIFEEIHLEGLDIEQIWAQTQMIVEGVLEKVVQEEVPELIQEGVVKASSFMPLDMGDDSEDEEEEAFGEQQDSEEEEEAAFGDEDLEEAGEGLKASLEDDSDFEVDIEQDDYQESDVEIEGDGQEVGEEGEEEDEEEEEEEEEDDDDEVETEAAKELNDEFFKLESFKKQIEALDRQAENNEDDGEEDIDYFADPSSIANIANDKGGDDEGDGMDALRYDDFFAPPKKKRDYSRRAMNNKKKTKKPVKKQAEEEQEEEFTGFDLDADENEYEKAMSSVRKDLFEDEDEEEEEGQGQSKKEVLSTLEKQQLELQREIEKYETENVTKKTWEMKGEATAKERPANSLLESDLDFERSRKPAPVITQEVIDDLEEMIKKRVKKGDFDDLPRRLPDSIPNYRPSKFSDVQETKSKKSLGELYEEDYLKQNDPDAYEAKQNEQLDGTHQEVINMFNNLTHKLDSLSAWHYTPKAPTPSITIVTEAPAISMEDAQPTAMSTETSLAPQEVYRPTADKTNRAEVIGPDGLPITRAEMSREDKKRLRRRIKARRSKAFEAKEEKQRSMAHKSGSKAEIMQNLKKGNVTIIDKKGDKRDVSGKLKTDKAPAKINELRL